MSMSIISAFLMDRFRQFLGFNWKIYSEFRAEKQLFRKNCNAKIGELVIVFCLMFINNLKPIIPLSNILCLCDVKAVVYNF